MHEGILKENLPPFWTRRFTPHLRWLSNPSWYILNPAKLLACWLLERRTIDFWWSVNHTFQSCDLLSSSIIDFGKIGNGWASVSWIDWVCFITGFRALERVVPFCRYLVSSFRVDNFFGQSLERIWSAVANNIVGENIGNGTGLLSDA
jgi:hypothetical protein